MNSAAVRYVIENRDINIKKNGNANDDITMFNPALMFSCICTHSTVRTECWEIQALLMRAFWLEKHAELGMVEKLLPSLTTSQTWTCNSLKRREKMEVTWPGRNWPCGFGMRHEGLKLWSTDVRHSWPALEIFINFWRLFWGLPGWLWRNCALGSPWSPKQ